MINFISFSDEFSKIAAHWLQEAEQALAHKVMKTPGALAKATPAARKDVFRAMDNSARLVPGKTVTKVGSVGAHAAELAGLGMLAAPTIQKMRGKPMSEKNKDRAELGGLGVLAAPSALALKKPALEFGKHLLKRGSVDKVSMPTGTLRAGALQGAHMAKSVATGGSEAAQKMKNLAAAAARNKALAGAGTTQFAAHSLPVVQGKLL